jgi:acyl-CoA thioester hydrolase
MNSHTPLCPPVDADRLRPTAKARILYADTDKMGIAYHAAYLRYMELGRVEFIRASGMPYTHMERQGLALPLTDVAVRYRSPAHYDDHMTVCVGLSLLTRVRVHFDYRFVVAAGDREGLDQDVEILTAQTRHACVRIAEGTPQRLPPAVYDVLRSCYTEPPR